MTEKILVVGAGITGATIAMMAANLGKDVLVYEQEEHIGGACYDTIENGAYVQKHGSHIFHTQSKALTKMVQDLVLWLPYVHKVVSSIRGNLVPIPVNQTSLELLYGQEKAKSIFSKFEQDDIYTLQELFTLEGPCDLYKIFAKKIKQEIYEGYSTKQWGKMPSDEVLNRVKAFRNNRDNRYFTDYFQGIPFAGFSNMIQVMLTHPNIKVVTKNKFTLSTATVFDYVFYTGSVDELYDYKFGELPYRTCTFVNKYNSIPHTQSTPVINYPEVSYQFTRSHDYSYYMPGLPKSVVSYEYPCDFDKNNTSQTRYYPIKTDENLALYQKYVDYTKENWPNIYFAGRLGTYQYLDMDKAMLSAIELINKLFTNF